MGEVYDFGSREKLSADQLAARIETVKAMPAARRKLEDLPPNFEFTPTHSIEAGQRLWIEDRNVPGKGIFYKVLDPFFSGELGGQQYPEGILIQEIVDEATGGTGERKVIPGSNELEDTRYKYLCET